jgi:hypothetical protein
MNTPFCKWLVKFKKPIAFLCGTKVQYQSSEHLFLGASADRAVPAVQLGFIELFVIGKLHEQKAHKAIIC